MVSSSVLARLCALASLIAMLLVTAAGAAPASPAASSAANGEVMPGALIPLYASQQDSFTRVSPARQRPYSANAATINVTYNGFSPQAQAAFQYAVDLWEPLLTSAVPIQVIANWTALPPGVLGSAGPANFYRDWTTGTPPPVANRWYPAALANKLAGLDRNPSGADINANFSSAFPNWYFGTDGNTPGGDYDFVSVVLHELGHGLGFVGSATVGGGNGSWGQGSGFPFTYDAFVENAGGTAITNSGAFANPSSALAAQLQGDALYFDGPAALAANGGQRPRLYAPATWQQGSSYSHLNEATYTAGNANSLMTPQIGTAEAIHNPGAITLGMFTDMGWETQAPAQASLTVEVGVGLNAADCATSNSLTVAPNTRVFYCFTVTNTGDVTLKSHTLTDDRLGTILNNFPYTLMPQASAFITSTTIVAATTTNTATWTASDGPATATDSDTATVTVGSSHKIYLPMLSNGRPALLGTASAAPIAQRPAVYQGEIFHTATINLPAMLPSGGHFYLSASPSAALPAKVDDQVVLRSGGASIFSYNYRLVNQPTAQLVEISRSTLAPYAGQAITANFADISGDQISATPMYLIWAP
jgi:hypothetical protein